MLLPRRLMGLPSQTWPGECRTPHGPRHTLIRKYCISISFYIWTGVQLGKAPIPFAAIPCPWEKHMPPDRRNIPFSRRKASIRTDIGYNMGPCMAHSGCGKSLLRELSSFTSLPPTAILICTQRFIEISCLFSETAPMYGFITLTLPHGIPSACPTTLPADMRNLSGEDNHVSFPVPCRHNR